MQYDLVFEGGAAKGMIFAGAVAELEAAGHSFGRLLGTSAGSITAAMLASGAGAQGLLAALSEKQGGRSVFEGFMATPERFTEEEIQRSALRGLLGELKVPGVGDVLGAKLHQEGAGAGLVPGASAIGHVLPGAQVGEQGEVLAHKADAPRLGRQGPAAVIPHGQPVLNEPGVEALQARHAAQRRRLAHPRGAKQGRHLAGQKRRVQVYPHRGAAGVSAGEMDQERLAHGVPPRVVYSAKSVTKLKATNSAEVCPAVV